MVLSTGTAREVRIDTHDYSLDPALVGRRVEVIVDERTVTAACLETGELACQHARVFARHLTITALAPTGPARNSGPMSSSPPRC